MAGESTHRYAGMGRDQVLRMTASMRQNFANVGLPYAFTDQGLVANTMDAHRLITAATKQGKEDAVVEGLFAAYFENEESPGDPAMLQRVAEAAGVEGAEALLAGDDLKQEVLDEAASLRMPQVNGVPHFILNDTVHVSGAQDADYFLHMFARLQRGSNM